MAETKGHQKKSKHPLVNIDRLHIDSDYLERRISVDIYLPTDVGLSDQVNLLLINDGQDLVTMGFENIFNSLLHQHQVEPIMCVGIHCGTDRINEYGTICQPDYKGVGAKAGRYVKFIFDELLPYIRKKYHMPSFKEKSFAGFSLGGLSAFDIVWNHPSEFSKVGMFSPSLWWRRKGYEDGYDDEKDRIMHMQVRKGGFFPWLKFFVQTGRLDEKADRNSNGIIDSIDDALDMIVSLKAKGYTDEHIEYLELEEGRHNVDTWASVLPDFLKWGWKNEQER